jgi:hypothetical protein
MHQVLVSGNQFVKGCPRLVKEAATRLEERLLLQQRGPSAGMKADFAVVRRVEPGQDTQQRRFANAVRSDQAGTLPRLEFKSKVGKEWSFVEAASKARTTQ